MERATGFETGVSGNTLETTDPGNPDTPDGMSATHPTYSTQHPAHGSLGVKYTAINNVQAFLWTSLGSFTGNVYARFYLYIEDLPSDNNFYPLNFRTSADASSGILRVLSTGIIQMRDSSNSQIGSDSSVAVATDQLIRIEVRCNTGAGEMEYRYYASADSDVITATGSATGASLGANIDRVAFGHNTLGIAAGYTTWWDSVAFSSTDWIGPVESGFGFKRLAGPQLLGTSAATLFTVPTVSRDRISHIRLVNNSGSPVTATLSIGTDAAATRIRDADTLAAGESKSIRGPFTLEAGEFIQGFAGTAGVVTATVLGFRETL